MVSKSQNHFDIVIVGGGLVGASLACALASTDLRIAVVEAAPYDTEQQPSYDDRVLAIARGSARILDSIGVWPEISPAAITLIKSIHISDRGHFGAARLHHYNHGVDALGYTISARALGQTLITRLKREAMVKIFCPARVEQHVIDSSRIALTLAGVTDVDHLTCQLMVFADGSASDMRQGLGFETELRNYQQSAVLTTVTPGIKHNNTAYERFTDSGPMALLPAPGNKYAVVCTTSAAAVGDLVRCSDKDFLSMLQIRFGDRVGNFSALGKRRHYPLSFLYVDQPFRPRVVVVGNAAHTVHPVAGQGFNLGLRDVSTLAEVVVNAKKAGRDVGDTAVLHQYWRWRQRDISRVGQFTDGLIRIFTSDFWPLALLRDTALITVDLVPAVQRELVIRTMGLKGKLPRLSRGLPLE